MNHLFDPRAVRYKKCDVHHPRFGSGSRVTLTKLPATELDSKSDSELGELEEMRETELVGDVNAAMGRVISKEENAGGKQMQFTRWRYGYGGSSWRMSSRW